VGAGAPPRELKPTEAERLAEAELCGGDETAGEIRDSGFVAGCSRLLSLDEGRELVSPTDLEGDCVVNTVRDLRRASGELNGAGARGRPGAGGVRAWAAEGRGGVGEAPSEATAVGEASSDVEA